MPFRVCGTPDILLTPQSTSILALPNGLFRADSVTLSHENAAEPPAGVVDVQRDGRRVPTSVDLPARADASVLTLPQNVNDGWSASLDGDQLDPVRVDGWKQGWRVPAGEEGSVELSYRPGTAFSVLLGAGVVALVGVLLVAVLPRRRRPTRPDAAALSAGRPGVLDVGVALVAGGLLAGWWGIAGMLAALAAGLVFRRFTGWGWLAGLALVVGGLALGTDRITRETWAVTWSQAWVLGAACLTVAGLAALRAQTGAQPTEARSGRASTSMRAKKRRFFHRITGRSMR